MDYYLNRSEELPPDFLVKQTPLPKISEEFGAVEYLVQLSLSSPSAKLLNAWTIGNPHLTIQFEKRTQGILVVDSWVETSLLSDMNTVSDISQKGFKIGQNGMTFQTGCMNLKRSPDDKIKKVYEFLLCKVGIGKCYCLESNTVNSSKTRVDLPENYDSIYIHKSEETDPVPYWHEYLIFDSSQVLPVYLVQFEYDPEEDEKKRAPRCEVCERNTATIFCKTDSARLCESCDDQVHSANKLLSRHVRVALNEQPQGFGNCPHHPHLGVEFFCPVCQIPVCVHCKMIGNHSSGEAASHKLIPISDAYRSAIRSAEKDDPLLDGKKQAIFNHLSRIDDKLRMINQNSSEIEERVYQLFREALFQLQTETQKKMAVLLGEEIELRRQLEQMEWLENFLRLQRLVTSPTEFLYAWNRHMKLRSEMHSFEHLQNHLDVKPDLMLLGRLDVITEERLREPEPQVEEHWAEEIPQGEMSATASMFRNTTLFAPKRPSEATPYPVPQYAPGASNQLNVSALGGIQDDKNSRYNVKKTQDLWTESLRKRTLLASNEELGQKPISMSEEGEKKKLMLQVNGVKVNHVPFAESKILKTADQAFVIYYCLPFHNVPPTRLLFATWQQGSSISALHSQCDAAGPTVLIARSGEYIFGGFASTSWNTSQIPFGTPKSFLFSVTKNLKIPSLEREGTIHLWASPNSITFGKIDLCFEDDLRNCSSEIENSYGIGLKPKSQEAKCFMAGRHQFEVNVLEVWGFSSPTT